MFDMFADIIKVFIL